jgi:3-oxoadipate enol-lactonase
VSEGPFGGRSPDGSPLHLPPARSVLLADRGTTVVRELGVGRDGPTLVLLHGWTVTSDLNWAGVYEALGRHFHVIALDHRGHGRGLRGEQRFTLEACADDVAALADTLGLERIIPVGYSMGGLVAQLVWRRHASRVAGLVLAATSRNFQGTLGDRVYFGGLAALAQGYRLAPRSLSEAALNRFISARTARFEPWQWAAGEVASGDVHAYFEAATAIGSFSSHEWVGEIDVPTAVLINTEDRSVPTWRQRKLAEAVPAGRVWEVQGDHHVVVLDAERYAVTLIEACNWVRSNIAPPG